MTSDSRTPIGRDPRIMAYQESITFACDPARLFNILGDPAQWPDEGEPRVLKRRETDFVQVAFADFTRASISISRAPGGQGTALTLEHDLCTELSQVNHWRDYWKSFFETLRTRVEI